MWFTWSYGSYLIFLESRRVVSGMSTVWKYAYGCAKQYMCGLAIYLMTVLSTSYGILMDRSINIPGHVNNVADGINATDKRYLKEKIEFIGKFASNDNTNIGMLPSPSKYVYINFADKCPHILNNKERLNGLKGSTKMKKIQ